MEKKQNKTCAMDIFWACQFSQKVGIVILIVVYSPPFFSNTDIPGYNFRSP